METKKLTIAICPQCNNPLISTLLFAQAEWFCMGCKNTYGLFYSETVQQTPELHAKLKQDLKEFNTFKNDLYLGGEKINGCKLCREKNEPHIRHLTEEERNKCIEARNKIGWYK